MKTTIVSAADQDTVMIKDITDLLILVIYHAKNITYKIFFRRETRKNARKLGSC